MHLIYFDESGNTGTNLTDPQQPVFVLAALIVPEESWIELENQLEMSISRICPSLPIDTEVHAQELRSGNGSFKGVSVADRIRLRDDWFKIAKAHSLKVVYRSIEKKRFHKWLVHTFGSGIIINPHVAAFALVATVVNEHLISMGENTLGIFISDENKEIVRDIEKSISVLRRQNGSLRLNRIVEKGFFIDSAKSRLLQLCDLCAFSIRKHEERSIGLPAKEIDDSGIRIVRTLIHRGDEKLLDVLKWLEDERKGRQ